MELIIASSNQNKLLEFKKILGDKIDYKFSNRRDGDVEQLIADTSKILKHIDWSPKYNDLSKIINSSIKWEEKINESNT